MKKSVCVVLISIVLVVYGCGENQNFSDLLYKGFQDPPATARPFVRWWWNDNRVTIEETLRELDIMKEAGIGGFEMNPISAVNPSKASQDATIKLAWLSSEWNKVVKATADGARERGLIPDLLVGSGWPAGGRFLEPGEQIQIITVNKQELVGPAVFTGTVKDLTRAAVAMGGSRRREQLPENVNAKLIFLRLVHHPMQSFETGIDLMDRASSDGTVQFDIPDGKYLLYAGAWREGYRQVVGGCLGAEGPVVDHLNKKAVQKYLDRMSDALNPFFGGALGNSLRAMFFDSFELGHTNWTNDFAEQFKKRRGYDLVPYLHYMVDLDSIVAEPVVADSLKRLRYDFNITIIELFMERFMTTYTEWCHEHRVKSRSQAYGREAHPLDTSFLVDLPEGETWIWGAEKQPHPCTINRFVASAAHLSGKSVVSAESMTNPVTPFRILPSDIKSTDDLNFISGTTHTVLHGFNYSPPGVEFPGWVRFGCFFSEHNTWWPYFKRWADYNARISWIMQNSLAQARVAILTPEVDIWSTVGRPYHPFAEREVTTPWYIYELWKVFHQNGFNVEYISDSVLAGATFEEGTVIFGPRAYEVIILEDLQSILPKTAQQLEKFAESGGKIIYIGQTPHRSPSFKNASTNDELVKKSIDASLKINPKNVGIVTSPESDNILEWVKITMELFDVRPDVEISHPNAHLSQIYHKTAEHDIFFFTWSDTSQSIDFTARFKIEKKIPYVWNPETAERFRYPVKGHGSDLAIHLEPQESILLIFEPTEIDCPVFKKSIIDRHNSEILSTEWQVTFQHAVRDTSFTKQMNELVDIGQSDEEELNRFAGIVCYHSKFKTNDTSHTMLDLGKVFGISEVRLNDQPLGICWYGVHSYDVSNVLKQGENLLEVKVTTHLGNLLRGAPRNTSAGRYSWWYPAEKMGILGPVRLCKKNTVIE
ncbi:hypothetical protein JW935_17850 [candidate division KSB1 bacterium]|nr:hypothetical protein [candidate division KSB1 bacterium]